MSISPSTAGPIAIPTIKKQRDVGDPDLPGDKAGDSTDGQNKAAGKQRMLRNVNCG